MLVLGIGWSVPADEPTTRGKLTVTENLIRREILRLGGDWESGAKPKLVGFEGENFKSPHFEMLTHLPTVEFFSARDCKVDDYAIKCLSSVISLRRLDLVRCEVDANCLSLLRSNRELRSLGFEEMRLSDKTMEEVTRLSQVETLVLIDVDASAVSDTTIDRIARMESLKEFVVSNCPGMTETRIKKIKSRLPKLERE